MFIILGRGEEKKTKVDVVVFILPAQRLRKKADQDASTAKQT